MIRYFLLISNEMLKSVLPSSVILEIDQLQKSNLFFQNLPFLKMTLFFIQNLPFLKKTLFLTQRMKNLKNALFLIQKLQILTIAIRILHRMFLSLKHCLALTTDKCYLESAFIKGFRANLFYIGRYNNPNSKYLFRNRTPESELSARYLMQAYRTNFRVSNSDRDYRAHV